MSKPIHILLLLLLSFLSSAVHAQWAEIAQGSHDARTLRVQTKAEALYVRGDFKRAQFIYANELAPLGDKYAQYMVGYLYLTGQGVSEDPVLASAWYRLAAERDTPEFVLIRDGLVQSLNPEQRAHSDSLYLDLRKELSDLVVVMRMVEADLKKLRFETTGSRLPSRTSMVTMIDPRTGTTVAADYNRVLRTMQARVDFITTQLDIESLNADLSKAQVDELWGLIGEYVAVVDDEFDSFAGTP